MRKKSEILSRILSAALAVILVFGSISIPAAAAGESETLVAWEYTAAAKNALTKEDPAGATAGSGSLWAEGAVYGGGYSTGSLPATGWEDGAWCISVNAENYQSLTFSAKMRSSKTGPAEFQLEYLLDGAESWTVIDGSAIKMPENSTSLKEYYANFILPAELSGKAFTLRVHQTSMVAVNNGTVASGGVSNINNITIKGVKMGESTEPTPEPTPDPAPEPTPVPSDTIGAQISHLQDGDTFILYNPNGKTVLTTELNGTRLKGTAAEPSADNVMKAPEGTAVLKASADENGYYTFTCGGKYLTTKSTGGSLTLEDSASDYSLWALEPADENGGYLIRSVNAAYNNIKNQYMEYYSSNFTTYGYRESNKVLHLMYFYRAAAPSADDYTVEEDTVLNVAQWAGNANYDEAKAELEVNGDLYQTNDMKDSDAKYSVVVNGQNVKTFTTGTTQTGTSYYMGGTGLGSGSNDYVQLALSSSGYAHMNLSFRLRASNTGAGSYQLQYSTDGINFENFTTGTYAYKYTSYGSDGTPKDVSGEGAITDGIAKTSYAATKYVAFSFAVPKGAENAKTLFIRLIPGTENAKGSGAPTSGGTLRMDSVVLTGSPIISDGICSYVKAEPVSGEASIGTELTLSCDTEGAVIYYSIDGGEYQVYDAAAKPVLNQMPANIRTYASKDGLADSIKVIYSYTLGKVKNVKASPNGGAVLKDTKVSLKCDTEGAAILYSEDEGASWNEYTSPLTLSNLPKSYQVKAVKEGYEDSNVLTLAYTERTSEKYNIYFGQLHSHTSYSDGAGSADSAFNYASNKAENLDFLALTDHSNSYDNADNANINDGSASAEWQEGHALADQYTTDDFVGIMGYEMTWANGLGHMNTFNSNGFQSRTQTAYSTYSTALQNYYATLETAPDSISQFNHPGTTFGDFNDFAYYDEDIDKLITTIEVGNGEGAVGSSGYFPSYQYYQRALDKGWHVAPTNNQDNHKGLWGDANTARSVVLADSLTRENIYDAMRNYRVYATEDNDLSIYYTLDGYEMGSILTDGQTGDTVSIKAELNDPTDGKIGKVQVITNGGLVLAEKNVDTNEDTVEFTVDNKYSYYYLKIVEGDSDIAVTAPVWVGEVEAAGINSFTTDEVLPVQGQALTANLELYNNEDESMQINSIAFSVDGQVVHTADLEAAGLTSVPAMGTAKYGFDFTYDKVGSMEITATVNATLNGAPKVYEKNLKLTYVTPKMVTKVVIDGTHYNDYVTGYYGGNMGNFTKIAGQKNVKVEIATEKITAETLEDCALLVVSAPARKSGTANAGDYSQSCFEDAFIETVKAYVENGGNVIVCGLADYQDKAQSDTDKHASAQLNKLLAAIGSTMRINDDEVYDPVNNGGQFYRLYPSVFNTQSKWTDGIITSEDNPDHYQKYSQYSGCSVDPGNGEWLVRGFDTTYSVDSDKDGVGNTEEIETDDSYGYAVVTPKGNTVFLASEDTAYGGTVFAAGGVFLSDFEVAAEMDNVWDLPYANRTIAENILNGIKVELEPMSIADFRQMDMGEVGAIEGYVTAGTSNENNKFFDAIYVQDDTAGITVFPYADAGLEIGTKVRITGYVDAYQGDREIQIMSIKVLSDVDKKVYEPELMKAADAMNYEKNGGKLVKVNGKVTRVLKDDTGKGISQFWMDDGSGQEANIFIDGYINSGTTGKNELASFVKEGATVSAVGLVYAHPEGESDEPVTCLRVRNIDEISTYAGSGDADNDNLPQEKPDKPGTDDSQNGKPENSNTQNDQIGNSNMQNGQAGNSVSGSNNQNNIVNTGDSAPVVGMIALALLSVGVIAVIVIRKRREHR